MIYLLFLYNFQLFFFNFDDIARFGLKAFNIVVSHADTLYYNFCCRGVQEAWTGDSNMSLSTSPTLTSPRHTQLRTSSPSNVQSRARSPRTQCNRQSRPSRRDFVKGHSSRSTRLSMGSLENIDFGMKIIIFVITIIFITLFSRNANMFEYVIRKISIFFKLYQ